MKTSERLTRAWDHLCMAGEILGTAMSETQSHGTHGELKVLHDRVMDIADDMRELRDDQEKVENDSN